MRADPRTTAATVPVAPSGAGRADAVRVGILGVNAWLVALVIPAARLALGSPLEIALGLAPPVALGLGLAWMERRPGAARWALLGGFAPSLCLAIAARPALAEGEAYAPVTAALAAVSLLAFLAAAAHAVGRGGPPREATVHPLRSKDPVSEPVGRRWTRRTLLAITGVGALAIGVVAPVWGGAAGRTEAWGDAASEGIALTSVIGCLVAAVALGAVVGPGLRAERAGAERASQDRRRLVGSLVGAALLGGLWLLLTLLDADA